MSKYYPNQSVTKSILTKSKADLGKCPKGRAFVCSFDWELHLTLQMTPGLAHRRWSINMWEVDKLPFSSATGQHCSLSEAPTLDSNLTLNLVYPLRMPTTVYFFASFVSVFTLNDGPRRARAIWLFSILLEAPSTISRCSVNVCQVNQRAHFSVLCGTIHWYCPSLLLSDLRVINKLIKW